MRPTSSTNPATPFEVIIWGCRGSVSIGGEHCQRFGGTTTCIELDFADARIVIDAGSGLATLGRSRGVDRKPMLLLMTHLHSDHVIGLPHFAPLYVPDWTLDLRGVPREGRSVDEWLMDVHKPPFFPLPLRDAIRCDLQHRALDLVGSDTFYGVEVAWIEVAHPGGCSAFRFDVGGRRIVFSGDLELEAMDREALAAFCQGADLLIMDAQYNDEEYPSHVGWGHTTNTQAARFARDCGVKRLILTHHDPRHNDAMLDQMVDEARGIFAATEAAVCGMRIAFEPVAD